MTGVQELGFVEIAAAPEKPLHDQTIVDEHGNLKARRIPPEKVLSGHFRL